MSGTHHQGEYLPPDPRIEYTGHSPYHGSADERNQRWMELRAVTRGDKDWKDVVTLESWEHPIDVVAALGCGADLDIPIINLPNRDCLPDVPAGRIVEAPARVRGGQVQGQHVGALPGGVAKVCRQVSDVHELVAEGAAVGSREKLADAIRCDLAIPDKSRALAALDRLLEAHRDILPQFDRPGR